MKFLIKEINFQQRKNEFSTKSVIVDISDKKYFSFKSKTVEYNEKILIFDNLIES